MFYKCLLCANKKELRKSKNANSPLAKYRALEKQLKNSRLVHLHKTSGTRNLCPNCLQVLVDWQAATA
jgi:hypothetical protein